MRKRAAATGNVQRGLFYLEKGDVLGAFFFFFFFPLLLQSHILCFPVQKKSRRKQSGVKGLASLTKARRGFFFFFPLVFFSGTLDFLRNYINSGVFKSVFHRQKGGKL